MCTILVPGIKCTIFGTQNQDCEYFYPSTQRSTKKLSNLYERYRVKSSAIRYNDDVQICNLVATAAEMIGLACVELRLAYLVI